MEERANRSQVTSTGRELLAAGLVARTWGNVSCRLDEKRFLITPSGLDYLQTQDEDLAIYNMETKEWRGPHKPSSEKGVHASAYDVFPEVGFVIHTHQAYATAIGVAGLETLNISAEDEALLGGIAVADYGLPGTKKLKKAVRKAFESGAHTVFMKYHGAVVAGTSKEDAYAKVLLLEKICERSCKGLFDVDANAGEIQRKEMLAQLKKDYPNADWDTSQATLCCAAKKKAVKAQMDDMGQMIGGALKVCEPNLDAIKAGLAKTNALLVPGLGAVVNGMDAGDTEALKILVNKSCICALHTEVFGIHKKLKGFDIALMHFVYQKKYSKKKNK